jgi:8-amino-3,8-dideoxy-alpha-D-manno-octulosonate transaminase
MTEKNRLASQGGKAALTQPLPPTYPGGMRIDEAEERHVLEALRTKRLFRYYGPNPGPSKVEELEQKFAAFMGTQYAQAVTSGTAALICGLAGMGIGPGDEVIVPAYTWIASASAVVAVGAVPVMAEVDASLTLDPVDVAHKISAYTKAIMPVHMRGAASDMDPLMALARKHGLKVIEDTAQADGASYHGKRLGSIGDVGTFSLQFNKIITSGEGGMVITNDHEVFVRAAMYHDVIGGMRNNVPADQILPGINFRMPELLGAVALAQLEKLDDLLRAMRYHKQMVKESMTEVAARKGVTFRVQNDPAGDASVALIFFTPDAEGALRVAAELNAEGAGAAVLYKPEATDYHIYAHWTPIMGQRTWHPKAGPWRTHPRKIVYTRDMCPKSLDLLGRAVHLDINPEMSSQNLEELAEAVNKVLDAVL